MEPKVVSALVASLLSQALFSFLLPSPLSNKPYNSQSQFLPLLLHLLTASQIAVATSLLPRSNKRKRQQEHQRHHEPWNWGLLTPSPGSPCPGPDQYRLSFRMSSSTFDWLSGLLDPLLDCRDPAGSSLGLPGPTRLALALSRLAAGAPYPDIARRFAVSEHAARFCARHLCRVLCTNFRFWLAFPSSPADLREVSDGFWSLSGGLPDCCGAVGCARFEIGGGRSMAAQIVTDSSSRILSIAAGFRGEKGDGEVLRSSSLYKDVEGGRLLLGSDQYLVGGFGYPLLPWLMVPFANAGGGSIEEDFSAVLASMCRPVQRAVSSLRNWGVMSRLMEEEDGKMAVACIGTCAILHNVLLMRGDCSSLSDESMESVEKFEHNAAEGLEEECFAEKKGSVLRSTLAVKARAIRDPGVNS